MESALVTRIWVCITALPVSPKPSRRIIKVHMCVEVLCWKRKEEDCGCSSLGMVD